MIDLISYQKNLFEPVQTHLHTPPPFSCMHIMKEMYCMVIIGIVPFGYEYQVRRKFWITKEGLYALNDIP